MKLGRIRNIIWDVWVGAFNKGKVLVGALSVIVKTDCETDGSSAALISADEEWVQGPNLTISI